MLRAFSAVLVTLVPTMAIAHTGLGDQGGFAHGFMHPVTGLDHVLAMVAVGVLAARLSGRALWQVPLAFVVMMVAGGMIGMAGLGLPFVEAGIALSLVALGAALAFDLRVPVAAAAAAVGLFAVFHGYAHGAEMPESVSGFAYGGGFVCATALLHVAGIGLGLALGRLSPAAAPLTRIAGGATAAVGFAILGGAV